MKSSSLIVAAILSAVWAAAAFGGPRYRLHVTGLACPFCAYGIEKKLSEIEGVERVETHIKEGAVIVTMRDGATLDEAVARQAVRAAGFTLEKLDVVDPDARK